MYTWLAACDKDDDGTEPVAEVSCAVDAAHPLRVRCTFQGDAAHASFTREGESLTFGDDGAGVIVAWGLPAETAYDVVVTVDGQETLRETVSTGVLPDGVGLTFEELIPGPTAVDHLVFPTSCDGTDKVYVTDAYGVVKWYSAAGVTGGLIGFDVTDDGVAVLAGRRWVRELPWVGGVGAAAERDLDGDSFPHHALDVGPAGIAVLDTRPREFPDGITYLDDGVSVVDGDGLQNLFTVGDLLDPQGRIEYPPLYWTGTFPYAVDAIHLNSVDQLADGGFLMSAKHMDLVFAVTPDFALDWVVAGSNGSPQGLAEALTPVGDVGFEFPHHANRAPWGNVLVFDNGRYLDASSVVEFSVDEVARTATLVRRWDLGIRCPIQGSAFGLPDGSVLATCAGNRELFELDDGGVRRHVQVGCANGTAADLIVRALPLSLAERR